MAKWLIFPENASEIELFQRAKKTLHLDTCMSDCDANSVVFMVIGDTGVGKSQLGNRILETGPDPSRCVFAANALPDPVTLEPQAGMAEIDGLTRCVIDTEGYANGNDASSEQIQKLGRFLREWEKGVNAVCIVLNGQAEIRFSQGVKDILQWVYHEFGTPEILSHICIVFTMCYDNAPRPDRGILRGQYRERVEEHLRIVSGLNEVPDIPVFFVDSTDYESHNTNENIAELVKWAVTKECLCTHDIEDAPLRERNEEEIVSKFIRYEFENTGKVPGKEQTRYSVYQDRRRMVITPNNGDPVRYSEWEELPVRKERSGTRKTIERNRENQWEEVQFHRAHSVFGFSSEDHTHYWACVDSWRERVTVTTDLDGKVSESKPMIIGEVRRQRNEQRRHGRHGVEGFTRDRRFLGPK
jgi:hypothetical protein